MDRIIAVGLILILFVTPVFAGVDFDGTDDLANCGDITDMDGATAATFIAVVNPDDTSMDLLHKWDDGDYPNGDSFQFYITSGDIGGGILDDDGDYTFHESTTASISAGTTYCLAMVWGGNQTFAFYKDGSDVGDADTASSGTVDEIRNSTRDMLIAAGYDSGDAGLEGWGNGQIYHIALWNTNLTQAQVQQVCSAKVKTTPMQVAETNLLMDYWLDEGSDGTSADTETATDRAGGGNACTFDDGAGNANMTWAAEVAWSYQ